MINMFNVDCMEFMAGKPDKFYDLAIVDPPYGINCSKTINIKNESRGFSGLKLHEKKEWDVSRPTAEYFAELQRVSKNQIIWGGNYFADLLPPKKGWIFWDKKITNANNTNFSDGELAWTSFDCILRRFTYDWIGFGYLNNPQREKKIHPTQKPVPLYEWLLRTYAKPGDKILDTHGGSMSSAIACHNLDFSLDICEIDADYFEQAKARFENHCKQVRLTDLI